MERLSGKSTVEVLRDLVTWLGDDAAAGLRSAFAYMETDLGEGMRKANAILARLHRAQRRSGGEPKGAA